MALGKLQLALFLIIWPLAAICGAQEELEQDPIVIKGNQGLPKALYIAPWKRVGTPLQSDELQGEIGEQPEPVERDLFQRELELQSQEYDSAGPSEPSAQQH